MSNRFFLLSMIVVCALAHPVVSSIPPQELYLQAHELYKAGKFDKAYENYQQIPNKSAYVNYNLGNCAYKLGKYGYALLYWKRAEAHWGVFNRSELLHNIELVKKRLAELSQNNEDQPRSSIGIWAEKCKSAVISLMQSIPLLYLQLIFLFVWISLFVIRRCPVERSLKYATIPLVFVVGTLCSMLAMKYGFRFMKHGIVVASQATVRSGPGETFQVLMNVREGDEGTIKAMASDYYKVAFNGKIGWISKQVFEKI